MHKEQLIVMGNRIQLRRKELGFTQNKLAELLDISNNHMSAIENAREKPSLDIFLALCETLKTTPDFLLMGIIHPNNVPQNITDNLRLCTPEDINLAEQIIEILVRKNQKFWNDNHII